VSGGLDLGLVPRHGRRGSCRIDFLPLFISAHTEIWGWTPVNCSLTNELWEGIWGRATPRAGLLIANRTSKSLPAYEGQQVGVDLVCVRGRHAVREARVGF
jgi:hypothetical protein